MLRMDTHTHVLNTKKKLVPPKRQFACLDEKKKKTDKKKVEWMGNWCPRGSR